MPTIPDGGCNEREDPSLLDPSVLHAATGVEYLPGRSGIFTARGRDLFTTVQGTTGRSLYRAGYDDGTDYLIYHEADNYRPVAVAGAASTVTRECGTDSTPLAGCHYGNRHYLVNGVSNLVAERDTSCGVTFRAAGMAKTGAAIGVSVLGGSGSFSVTTGLIYWATEYDSARGIESVYGSTSTSSGGFASKDGIVLTITGTTKNPQATHYRIYRTTDGGEFPDGGLLATIDISNTSYTDTYTSAAVLLTPNYGTIQVNDLDFDRDAAPPVLSTITEFSDSLCGFPPNSRSFRFSAAGYPESWPAIYEVPIDSELHDIGMGAAELNGVLGLFTRDSVWRLARLPREIDSAFAAGEGRVRVTGERGCVSRKGLARFVIPGQGALLAFVSRDGIWATNLDPSGTVPLTDGANWDTRVEAAYLDQSELINDPANRRLVFLYRKPGDAENRGVMYLNYERGGVRITHADHGSLSAAATCAKDGVLKLFTTDARTGDGRIYMEGGTRDASELVDAAGTVNWAVETGETFPAGPHGSETIERIAWLHDLTDSTVRAAYWVDRTANPIRKQVDFSADSLADLGISRGANSVRFGLEGGTTVPFGIHWFDALGVESRPLGGGEGA